MIEIPSSKEEKKSICPNSSPSHFEFNMGASTPPPTPPPLRGTRGRGRELKLLQKCCW